MKNTENFLDRVVENKCFEFVEKWLEIKIFKPMIRRIIQKLLKTLAEMIIEDEEGLNLNGFGKFKKTNKNSIQFIPGEIFKIISNKK